MLLGSLVSIPIILNNKTSRTLLSVHRITNFKLVSSSTSNFGLYIATTNSSAYPEIDSFSPSYGINGISWTSVANNTIPSPLGNEHISDMAISTNGKYALVDAGNSTGSDAYLTSLPSGTSINILSIDTNTGCSVGDLESVAFSPSGDYAYIVDNEAAADDFGCGGGYGLTVINLNSLSYSY
jgi:hypothetical protein